MERHGRTGAFLVIARLAAELAARRAFVLVVTVAVCFTAALGFLALALTLDGDGCLAFVLGVLCVLWDGRAIS